MTSVVQNFFFDWPDAYEPGRFCSGVVGRPMAGDDVSGGPEGNEFRILRGAAEKAATA